MNEPSNNHNYASYVTPEMRRGRLDAQWDRDRRPTAGAAPTARAALRAAECRRSGRLCPGRGLVVERRAQLWSLRVGRGAGTSDDAPVNFSLTEGTLIELDPRSEVELLRSNLTR